MGGYAFERMGNPLKGMGGISITSIMVCCPCMRLQVIGAYVPAYVDAANYLKDMYYRVVLLVNRKVPQCGRKIFMMNGV